MYAVTVRREFIAQHWLTVPDPGPEGERHSHQFRAELTIEAPALDEYGYVVDIDHVNDVLDELETRYRDATLNELPEFAGLNPSVERLAREFVDRVTDAVPTERLDRVTVRMWEDETAAATYATAL